MNGFLQQAVAEAERRVAQWRQEGLLEKLPARPTARDFVAALRRHGPGAVIAEIKRASPSRGVICSDCDVVRRATHYEQGGAAAISVLTESRWFGGSLEDLTTVRAATTLPVLRKDFVVDEYDLRVTAGIGGDAVLLIVAGLTQPRLTELLAITRELGLQALVETHSADELQVALDAGAELVGVNARNLRTLEVDGTGALELLSRVPASCLRVLESGVRARADVEAAIAAGADAVLVGEALMQAADPLARLRELTGASP